MSFVCKVVRILLPRVGKEYEHRLFSNPDCFIRHCRDHILNKNDIWTEILEESIVNDTRIIITSKNHSDVIRNLESGRLAELYEKVCDVIMDHVTKSMKIPMFAVTEKGTVQLWLTMDGMVVISREGVIRTAFFPGRRCDSKQTRFQEAWRYGVRKLIDAWSNIQERIDLITENNWSSPPGYAAYVTEYRDLIRKISN